MPIINHTNYQGDITKCKGCPTRKDASPSCTSLDGAACLLPVTKTVPSNVKQVSKRYPARKDASPSCTRLEESLSNQKRCISLMHQPSWKCASHKKCPSSIRQVNKRCPLRIGALALMHQPRGECPTTKDASPSCTSLAGSVCLLLVTKSVQAVSGK